MEKDNIPNIKQKGRHDNFEIKCRECTRHNVELRINSYWGIEIVCKECGNQQYFKAGAKQ